MNYNKLLAYLVLILLFSCNNKGTNEYDFLVFKGEHTFELDSLTSGSVANHYQLYEQGDKSYLFILTPHKGRMVYYDFDVREKMGEIRMEDGFGNFSVGGVPPSGFYIHNLDSILLYDYRRNNLYLGNSKGKVTKVFEFMKEYPTDRSYWGGIFQESKPYFLNDTLLSIGGAVQWGDAKIVKDQKVDILLNLKSNMVTRETLLPGDYLEDHFYPTTRLRPARALDEKNNRVYYSYYNSDSLFVRDLVSNSWGSFYAGVDERLPFRDIDNLQEFEEVEKGTENQMIYNLSQGGYYNVLYDAHHDLIIRIGFLGIEKFDYKRHKEVPYDFNLLLTFYDAKSYKNLGTYQLEKFDYRFLVFGEHSIFVTRPNLNRSDDSLIFYEYEFPEF
ncbi:hypothetical protein LZF95_16810 [Algoriphagus sp. AGSA1]|uniref:hypothetical protein n=1 Tax=Algoriphagus sp. AGSA1 TaxID=2907213 RepID=UPI001F26FED0|nr:hypothetical protein [Algoriphagus sp. AGSA1]MCE7056346.1 hypothetical protein [Algoriphagus sp. AGSA1]